MLGTLRDTMRWVREFIAGRFGAELPTVAWVADGHNGDRQLTAAYKYWVAFPLFQEQVGSTDGIESPLAVGLTDGITVVWSVGSGL